MTPREVNSLQKLFRVHFPELTARYEAEFAKCLGRFRMPCFAKSVERFLECGDYTKGIARIRGHGTPRHSVHESSM